MTLVYPLQIGQRGVVLQAFGNPLQTAVVKAIANTVANEESTACGQD